MAKYHHTSIRICKRKEHKAAPRKSRHAKKKKKGHIFKRSTKDKMLMIAGVCLRRMATDGKPVYDKTWLNGCTETRGQLDAM